jgi:hypothetical protein
MYYGSMAQVRNLHSLAAWQCRQRSVSILPSVHWLALEVVTTEHARQQSLPLLATLQPVQLPDLLVMSVQPGPCNAVDAVCDECDAARLLLLLLLTDLREGMLLLPVALAVESTGKGAVPEYRYCTDT